MFVYLPNPVLLVYVSNRYFLTTYNFDSIDPFERKLQQDVPEHEFDQYHRDTNSYEPIRVQFDTHLLDALVEAYPTHVSYVRNVLLPSLRNFWAETLSIVPASRIKVPLNGDCAADVKKTTGYALQDFVQYGSDNLRSISNIGDNVQFSNDGTSLVYNNVDLVVIVIPAEGTELCPLGQDADSGQLQTLAFATNCQHDQYDRPVVGYFGVCFGMIDPTDRSTKTHQRRLLTIAHEFTHILVSDQAFNASVHICMKLIHFLLSTGHDLV